MPYIEEYLLCRELHLSWRELQEMPKRVLDHWKLYRNTEAMVRNAEASRD